MPKKKVAAPEPTVPWPETTIESWTHLQDVIDPLAYRCVFRGQGASNWSLESSFNRVMPCQNEALALQWELSTILRFRSEAHAHLPPTVMPPNMFNLGALDTYCEWLMIMQHYGAPTRLLDWSQSPYVGAYFAVIEDSDNDAALWYFDSAAANRSVFARYRKTPGEFLDYASYSSDEIRGSAAEPMLYTAEKKMRTAREIAQQGVFTFANRLTVNQQDLIAQTCQGSAYGKIIIPSALRMQFCERLGLMNVTAASLFPGVEGVCSAIRDSLRLAVERLKMSAPAPMPQAE